MSHSVGSRRSKMRSLPATHRSASDARARMTRVRSRLFGAVICTANLMMPPSMTGVPQRRRLRRRRMMTTRPRRIARKLAGSGALQVSCCESRHPQLVTRNMQLQDDPRFLAAVAQFNAGQFYEAGDAFEELFFEAVRDEVEFVRAMLQVAVGAHHADTGQRRPAVERLEEALLAIDRVADDRGYDLARLRQDIRVLMRQIRGRAPLTWPTVARRA